MKNSPTSHRIVIIALLVLLTGLLACGPAEVATPTPTPTAAPPTPTPTRLAPAAPLLPTATPTPLPGVTATPTATAAPLPPAEKPKYGGVLRLATSSGAITLDPVRDAGSNWASSGVLANLWSYLLRVSPVNRTAVEPDLAESWTVSADGATWKFKIRPGVVDHEGNPYTAEDAYWGMVRYLERPNGLRAPRQTCMRSYVKPIWDKDKKPLPDGGAEVTGPSELTVRLIAPGAGFVACFTGGFNVFQPSKYVKPIDTDPSGKTRDLDHKKGEVVGTGPFMFDDLSVDNYFYLKRFDRYFRPGLPYLDGIHFFTIPEQSAWEAAFTVGKIDFLGGSVGPATISVATMERMKKQLGDTVTFPKVLAMGHQQFDVNLRRPPFGPADDPTARKVRTALQLTIDRGEINELVYDGVGHLVTPYFIGWDWIYTQKEWLAQYRGFDSTPAVKAKDIADAQKLMQEAGYGATNRLKVQILTSPTGQTAEYSQLVAKQLAKVYMDVSVVGLQDINPQKIKGDFELATDSVGTPFPDPDAYNTSIFFKYEDGGRNYSGWINPKWTELHYKQAVLSTNAERAPILREMARIFHDDVWQIGMIRPTVLQGYRSYVKGHVPPPYHFISYPFENVWLAK